MLLVGLCEWNITNVRPILTVMLKDVLRTFEAEILDIFIIEPQPKAWFTLATKTERRQKREIPYPFRSLLFRLRFTGFVWNFVLPSLSPLASPSLM